jgi:hypothetical protein
MIEGIDRDTARDLLIFDYWTKQSKPDDPILKPVFPAAVGLGMVGNQVAEYWNAPKSVIPDGEEEPHGIGRWTRQRWQAILVGSGIDVKIAGALDQQRALWWDLRHSQAACLHAIQAASQLEDEEEALKGVIAALVDRFEYGELRERDKDERLRYATEWREGAGVELRHARHMRRERHHIERTGGLLNAPLHQKAGRRHKKHRRGLHGLEHDPH